MKGNMKDEKEEQEKGAAVRKRNTLETNTTGTGPSERNEGDFRGIF